MNEAALTKLNERVAALNEHQQRLLATGVSADERKLCTLLSRASVLIIEDICRKELRGEDLRRVGRGTVGLEANPRSGARGAA
jgi:hypothetical protein